MTMSSRSLTGIARQLTRRECPGVPGYFHSPEVLGDDRSAGSLTLGADSSINSRPAVARALRRVKFVSVGRRECRGFLAGHEPSPLDDAPICQYLNVVALCF